MIRRVFGSATRQVHVETIKPTSPTPPYLKRYNLSSLDQYICRAYIPMVFFYPNYGCHNPQKIARRLKDSLSKTLTQYYPFAGRLTSGPYVDCNDEGVEFQEARIECGLSEILEKPEDQALDLIFPAGLVWGYVNNDSSPLVVRLNHFKCGGIAMVVCMSHNLGDTCTCCTFLTYWAAVTRRSGEEVPPHFLSSPSSDSITVPELLLPKKHWITRRFVFHNSKLAQLKATIAESGVQNPTRVGVLTALLYKCATSAAARADSGSFTPAVLIQPVNTRPQMVPPMPETCVGNLCWLIYTPTRDESETKLDALADQINKGKTQIRGIKDLDGNKCISGTDKYVHDNYKLYICSSLCRFPLYQVDFGWGKPIRVNLADTPFNNTFILMDTPCGEGIEALVSLEEQDMVTFECDKELLTYASLHSSALES